MDDVLWFVSETPTKLQRTKVYAQRFNTTTKGSKSTRDTKKDNFNKEEMAIITAFSRRTHQSATLIDERIVMPCIEVYH